MASPVPGGMGLEVSIQAKLTAIAVNLKRIAAMVEEKAAIPFISYLKKLFTADMHILKKQNLRTA